MLILYLRWFDNSAGKIKNDIEFPLSNLSLLNHFTPCASSTACDSCAVIDQYGTYYLQILRCKCYDQKVDKARMSGRSNTPCVLFYESTPNGRYVLDAVPLNTVPLEFSVKM